MLSVGLQKSRPGFSLNVAFEAPTPGIVALFGRSGCGKSTTIDLISGLLSPDAGHVTIDGETLVDTRARMSLPAERRRVGYVFQDSRLFPHFSVAGNLRYGLKRARGIERRIQFDDVVQLLGLQDFLARRPHALSGGERQRVALGRALLAQPRLLLLDEPLASLDTARREEVLPYLETLRDRLSIPMVYVSHQFEEVLRLATHVVLLDRGVVVAQGSPAEVSLRPELRAIVGTDAVGAVLEGTVVAVDSARKLVDLRLGRGVLRIGLREAPVGTAVRVQLLARDVILATQEPQGLSVRSAIEGVVEEVLDDEEDAKLIRVNIGDGATVLSRVTTAAAEALELRKGRAVWVLIKAISMRGHAFAAPAAASS